MKTTEREVISKGDFHKRVWCECGWNYSPAHGDSTFGPKYCPECGNYRGKLALPWKLEERGWESEVVRKVKTGVPADRNLLQSLFGLGFDYVDTSHHYEDRDGNRVNRV